MPFTGQGGLILPNDGKKLHNITCPYCGTTGDLIPFQNEHVVGGKLVPRGSLQKGWYRQLRACETCNSEKSSSEDDISAITMLPDLIRSNDDPEITQEALRKAKGA